MRHRALVLAAGRDQEREKRMELESHSRYQDENSRKGKRAEE